MRRDAIQYGGYSSTVYPISFVWLGGIYKSKKHLEHKISSQGIPNIWESSGFFFPYWIFILLFALNNLLNTGFVMKHGLIHQVFLSYLHFGELCECGLFDKLLSSYQYIVSEGNWVLTLNLTLTESTSEMYSRK